MPGNSPWSYAGASDFASMLMMNRLMGQNGGGFGASTPPWLNAFQSGIRHGIPGVPGICLVAAELWGARDWRTLLVRSFLLGKAQESRCWSLVVFGYRVAGARLLNTGGFSGATIQLVQTSITPVTLDPGVYYLAQTSSDATVQVRTINLPAASGGMLNVGSVEKVGTAANAASSGVLPSTLGAISSASFGPAMVAFER